MIPSVKNSCDNQFIGAQLLVRALEREGVEYIFAYPGSTSMIVHQCLLDSTIRVVLPRHEQGGCFAADGYARRSGKAGVCLATSGPGATNLVTAITDAYMDSVPLVAVTCQVNQRLIGKNAFQETDIIGMTRPCVKHSALVLEPSEIAQTIKDAFFIASHGRPGPVVIDIPSDVLKAACTPVYAEKPSLHSIHFPVNALPAEKLAQLGQLLASCRRPCIYAGGGIISAGAAPALKRLAERTRIPVATSLMGVGAFPENHELSLKFLGMHGAYAANFAVHECDLLLALSVRFSDRVTGDIKRFAPMATIVHVDVDASEINKNKHADLSFVCDVRYFLEQLLASGVSRCGQPEWLTKVFRWRKQHPFLLPQENGAICAPQVIETLARRTRERATIVTGVGQHQIWSAQFYNFRRPRQLLTSGGLGAMGFGLPAAIGACIAAPDDPNPVVLIDGDGSFQMNIQELATVYAMDLPLKMVIMNNQNLGMVAQWEERFFDGRHADTDMRLPKAGRSYPFFVQIAAGYGIPGAEVDSPEELDDAIAAMLAAKGPFLLDVHLDRTTQVLPMIPSGKTCEDVIMQ